jgi:phospholipase C
MAKQAALLIWVAMVCAAASIIISLQGCGGSSSSPSQPAPPPSSPPAVTGPSSGKFQHVVVIVQENRTPDNLFQDPVLIKNGADIAQSGLNSQGQTITLQPGPLATIYDLSHEHSAFVAMYNGGKMDGADQIPITCPSGMPNCAPPNPQFAYVNPSEVAPYFQMAETYAFGDRMFQTNQGPSFPAHQFILAGTSAPTATSNLFVAENPVGVHDSGSNTGCTAPSAETVALIDPSGDESSSQYPCFDHPTLTDLLEAKGVSWHYYAQDVSSSQTSIWTAPNAIKHICDPNTQDGVLTCTGTEWSSHVTLTPSQVLTDIANNQLAQVTWVTPDGADSDHPLGNTGGGPSWVASIVNAIGNGPYWSNTAIILTWDDWGGWYDHVAPTIVNSYEYGFRVPLIVISQYTKPAYITHTQHNFGSILKFIEEVFGTTTVGYADVKSDDLADCFDYSQVPLTFSVIPAEKDAHYFQTRPPTNIPPDTD